MTRMYHSWEKWEDFKYGFYGGMKCPQNNTLQLNYELLKNLHKFEIALKIITAEWKYSCEHNLTNESLNRIAYLGQAACALLYNSPAEESRAGYNLLSKSEQESADALANKYLNLWLGIYKYHETISTK